MSTFHKGPVGERLQDATGRWYWRIMEGDDCLAIAPINDHRATPEEAAADLVRVVNCALPLEPAFDAHHVDKFAVWDAHYERGRRDAFRQFRAVAGAIACSLLVIGCLVALVFLLTGCGTIRRAVTPQPLSVTVEKDGAMAATDGPIGQAAERTKGHADALDAAVDSYDVPGLAGEVKLHTKAIRQEQTTIQREATALADFANERNSGPWRLWAWMMAVGMGLGAIGILLGIGLAIWARRPRVGALTAVSGLAVLVTSYVLAAYIKYIIWGAMAMLLAAAIYSAWAARKNLFATPPVKAKAGKQSPPATEAATQATPAASQAPA